jgi:hypothetical protein
VNFLVCPFPSFGNYRYLHRQKPDAINVFEPFQTFKAYSRQEIYLTAANDQKVETGDVAILRITQVNMGLFGASCGY